MELSEEQKAQLKGWLDEGLGLSRIQTLLKETFGFSLTFIETRFLLEDLNLELKAEPPEPENKNGDGSAEEQPQGQEQTKEPNEPQASAEGSVQVSLDVIKRPDVVASGSVTFSDGETLSWQLDKLGRLGLIPGANPNYRPSDADVAQFQKALAQKLEHESLG